MHVREEVGDNYLSKAYNAYIKGKSVDTALHKVLHTTEETLQIKEYTLDDLLDIEGAFNNVSTEALASSLRTAQINPGICRWIEQMFSTRIVNSTLGDVNVRVRVKRGTHPRWSPIATYMAFSSRRADIYYGDSYRDNKQRLFGCGFAIRDRLRQEVLNF